MSISRPIFIIVPGAWHAPSSYEILANHLKATNATVLIAAHPSLNSAQPLTVTCTQDADTVRKLFLPLIEDEEKDVVLVAHSYGGVSGSGAAYGLSKFSRAKAGKRGGVIGIVFIAAFVIPEGASMKGMLGNPPYLLPDQPIPGLCETANPVDIFYHDVDSHTSSVLAQSLQPQALGAFETPAPPMAWQEPEFEGKLAYLRCTQDRAVPAFVQDMMMEKSQVMWLVKDIETSHSPFLSRPKELAELVMDCTNIFLSRNSGSATSKLS